MCKLANHPCETTPTFWATPIPATAEPSIRADKPRRSQTSVTSSLVIVMSLICAGCDSKKSESSGTPSANQVNPTAPAANPVNPADAPAAQEKARVAQAVAFRAGIEPPEPSLKLRGGERATSEVIAAYNQELARLIFKMKDAPETLEELVRKWPMPSLPTPPAGKRIVYDPVNRIIRLDPP